MKKHKRQSRVKRKNKWRPINRWSFARSPRMSRFVLRFPKALQLLGTRMDLKDIKSLVENYIVLYETLNKNEGKAQTLRLLKAVYGVAQRYAVSHQAEPIPFRKTDSEGFPLMVKTFKPFLKKDLSTRRCVLCILQLYKLVKCEVTDYDINTITGVGPSTSYDSTCSVPGSYFRFIGERNPELRNYAARYSRAWADTLEEMFPTRFLKQRIKEVQKLHRIHISTKNGPNGPSMALAYRDFIALRKSDSLYKSIVRLSMGLSNSKLLILMAKGFVVANKQDLKLEDMAIHSRLRIKSEAGAKARIFAIGDYFSQSALAGLHDWCFNWLSKQAEDGTFDQDRVANHVCEWTRKGVRIDSEDLTAATDRIPAKGVLLEIAQQIIGKELADDWINSLIDRDFTDPSGKQVRYAVGQPMGLKTSWALLALWHHAVFRTVLKLLSLKRNPKQPDYYVIGDDSCNISALTDVYRKIVIDFCQVSISPTKGFSESTLVDSLNPIGRAKINVAEMAKRVYINGFEITPISPVLIKEGIEYPEGFISLLYDAERRGYFKYSNPGVCNLAQLGYKPKRAVQLATFPLWPAPIQGNRLIEDWRASECSKFIIWDKIPIDVLETFTKRLLTGLVGKAVRDGTTQIMDSIHHLRSPDFTLPSDYKFWVQPMADLYNIAFNDILWNLAQAEIQSPGLTTRGLAYRSVQSTQIRESLKKLQVINDWRVLVTGAKNKRLEQHQVEARVLRMVYENIRIRLKELDLEEF